SRAAAARHAASPQHLGVGAAARLRRDGAVRRAAAPAAPRADRGAQTTGLRAPARAPRARADPEAPARRLRAEGHRAYGALSALTARARAHGVAAGCNGASARRS